MTAPDGGGGAARTYVALLDGGRREEAIEVEPLGPGLYAVRLGGRTHRVDAFRHDHGTISLLVDTESFSVQLDQRAAEVRVHVRDSTYPLEILDERRLRMRRAAGKLAARGRQVLAAPMPARVLRVMVRPGEPVREGQALLSLELLGMENEVRSPKDGQVADVHVAEGQAVEGGARLATVE